MQYTFEAIRSTIKENFVAMLNKSKIIYFIYFIFFY
jgi:hypothetical protein